MFDWLKSRFGGDTPVPLADDGTFGLLVKGYLEEIGEIRDFHSSRLKVSGLKAGRALLAYGPHEQVTLVTFILEKYLSALGSWRKATARSTYRASELDKAEALQVLLSQLLRRQLPFRDDDLLRLLKIANDHWKGFLWYKPHKSILGAIERSCANRDIPPPLATEIGRIAKLVGDPQSAYAEERALAERAESLLGDRAQPALKADTPWAETLLAEVEALDSERQADWKALLDHARTARAAKPSKKWLARAATLLDKVGPAAFAERVGAWLGNVQREKIDSLPLRNDTNASIVRGLIWTSSLLAPDVAARDVRQMAQYCFRKVGGHGAVSPKVGNACLYVLGQLPGMESVAMLNELLQKVKYPSARQMIEKALDAAAERNHMSRADLAELSVPDFGLDAQGRMEEPLGEHTAVLEIAAGHKTRLVWRKADGKLQRSVPAAVKAEHAEALKALQRRTKDIQSTLQSQAARIEKLFLRPTPWPYADWRARYLDHPLLRHLTHKLIWQLDDGTGRRAAMLADGKLRDCRGEPVTGDLEAAEVRLWHPAHAEVDEVLGWREWLYAQGITQPFKQAHREVYLLTDAERQTAQYSNRFAAHILRQHQMNALCQQRGWRYSLQGGFDSWNAPTLTLPDWNISAEFFVESVDDSMTEAGIYSYLSSDQVRFIRDGTPVALVEVEPIVFTEVMRDVDLFVGVCSIGNDPAWQDRGEQPGFNEYWREYSFGDLLESAKIRKGVLEHLVPKLKIADRCEIDGRFLRVKGKRRTYKIHLGSGNILMEPNDQYLCIVEGRGQDGADTRKLVLPFEGDHRMAVILSKAFMLADDDKITDPTILSQIGAAK